MANELFGVGNLPLIQSGYGLKTPFGILLPPGGRVAAYVRSTGRQDFDDDAIGQNLVLTLSDALKRVRSGQGDTVVVLPGHSESVLDPATTDMFANLLAGTRILGVGRGSNMPVLRWTGTASALNITKNDVCIAGLRLRMEGANGVVKAINWTGADGLFMHNDVEVASGATNKATIAFEVGTGADRLEIANNVWRGTNTHNVTDGIKIVAAVSQIRIVSNEMIFSATAGNGCIHATAAALNVKILGNIIHNDHTASTACVACDAVASTGVVADNYCGTISNGVATAQGIVLQAGCLWRGFNNQSCDEPAKGSIQAPTAPAT